MSESGQCTYDLIKNVQESWTLWEHETASVDLVLEALKDELVLLILVFPDALFCALLITFFFVFHVEHVSAKVENSLSIYLCGIALCITQ